MCAANTQQGWDFGESSAASCGPTNLNGSLPIERTGLPPNPVLGLSGSPAAPQQMCDDGVARKDLVASKAPFPVAWN